MHPICWAQVQPLTAWTARRIGSLCGFLLSSAPLRSPAAGRAPLKALPRTASKVRGLGHTQSLQLPRADDAAGTHEALSFSQVISSDIAGGGWSCWTGLEHVCLSFAGTTLAKDSPAAAVDRSITKGRACRFFGAGKSCASDPKLGGVRLVHFGCFEQAQEQLDEASSRKQQNLKPFSACAFLVRSVRLGFAFSSSTSRRSRHSPRRCFAALLLESKCKPSLPRGCARV